MRFFQNLGRRLTRTARSLRDKISGIGDAKLSTKRLEELEELFLRADFGRETTGEILDAVREARRRDLSAEVATVARDVLRSRLAGAEGRLELHSPPETISLMGINGGGKTTTAAKLADFFTRQGSSVILGACDTFRAAANEQIDGWAGRLGVEIVRSQRTADPAAVAHDALCAALARKKDLLILDTAGRLHTDQNLLGELAKVDRVLRKQRPTGIFHRWLVLDGHSGTNSLHQAEAFHGALNLTGIIITKLDGTAKGGALIAIHRTLHIPIYFVGVGEGVGDLLPFSVDAYLDALFSEN